MPINYCLFANNNEKYALLYQSKYLQQNNIVVFDRGYFSYELLFILMEHNIKVIFRVRENLKITECLENDKKTYMM